MVLKPKLGSQSWKVSCVYVRLVTASQQRYGNVTQVFEYGNLTMCWWFRRKRYVALKNKFLEFWDSI